MFKKIVVPMMSLFFVHSICRAQTPQPPAPQVHKPVVCKWTTLEGMQYYYSGVKIAGDDNLKTLLSPMNDAEINRLLNVSSSSHTFGVVSLIGGSACLIGGFVVAGQNYNSNTQSFNSTGTAGLVIGLVGVVVDYVGVFKILESDTSKFAAVQRYNAIVHGDDQVSWNRSQPELQTDLLAFKF